MAQIHIKDLSFAYPGGEPIFSHVNLSLDTSWRLGLVGRNGRGKTTFLRLLMGGFEHGGAIEAPEAFEYFPVEPEQPEAPALAVARGVIAPFARWEAEMKALAGQADSGALARYGEIEEAYAAADGYDINERIAAEAGRLGVGAEALERPFASLSGGERVKLLLAAIFLKKHRFLLIDEPTDHLDAEGRKSVARWLAGKSGFILVSHDRAFLDEAVNHILSINRADIELQAGNYSSWRHNRSLRDNFELAENRRLAADIARLKEAAARTEKWSGKLEKSKKGGRTAASDHGPAKLDKGYIGHQSARMMQRSKAIVRRQNRQIEEKEGLLKNVETADALKFRMLEPEKDRLVTCEGLALCYGARCLFEGLNLNIERGERIAVAGPNGSGKSSLLKLIRGELALGEGSVRRLPSLVISALPQETAFLSGGLRPFAEAQGIELSLFMAILRKLDFEREAFERDMASYSAGQRKKVCLAASLARPAHLFVWDEPLNYVDVLSREQIEAAVLACRPTMVFVEHDAEFIRKAATRRVAL